MVLFGIGAGLGLACAGCAFLLVGLGIVSTSAMVGVFRRRMSSGLRALHYQLCAALGAPAGAFLLWIGSNVFDLRLRSGQILSAGVASGIAAGLLLAFAGDHIARFAYNRFLLARTRRVVAQPCAR